jgi:hypothetical protein
MPSRLPFAIPVLFVLAFLPTPLWAESRAAVSLNGTWQFQRDGAAADAWKSVRVPSTFQDHEGTAFHGVGWYRRQIEPFALPEGKRAVLHFEAAATLAEVWWNGTRLGSHLGGWTPFRFDVTDLVRKARPGQSHELRVRLDEKVGHNTQGFLPIIAPHFGGLWQGVSLLIVPETAVDDLRLLALGNPKTGRLELEWPLQRAEAAPPKTVVVRYRLRGHDAWSEATFQDEAVRPRDGTIKLDVRVPDFKRWSPAEPNLYEVQVRLGTGAEADQITTRAAFRKIETAGRRLLLNGKPLGVRGVLNWGYYPPRLAPNPDEEVFRKDLEFARGLGFNLMKFCLWVPPRRYLELADEMGFLTWAEYPTWHPQLTKPNLPELTREFAEFFAHDRNHPSVILRSLTCETGPGADLAVIQALYDLAHRMVPGSVVEDDSSWIGWNRVHDFYDDHPYGNNHTWVATLNRLNEHVRTHGPKPLLLGEAIAVDTWVDREPLLKRVGKERPFWLPGFFEDNGRWLERMGKLTGSEGLDRLAADSRRYALLMRKYQIETFRREVPEGGYVVSVLRDFPLAGMGLLDYLDRPKWPRADWAWQGDTLLILKPAADRRTFAGGEKLRGEVLISHFGPQKREKNTLTVSVVEAGPNGREIGRVEKTVSGQEPGTLTKGIALDVPLPDVARPMPLLVRASLRDSADRSENEWPLWLVPKPKPVARPQVWLHDSLAPTLARELFPGAARFEGKPVEGVVVTARFDDALLDYLEAGGKVLLLPDGQKNSLPLRAHWFLRGGPFVANHPLLKKVPRELLVDVQHFDLAGDVVPDVNYVEQTDPILMLWDNHDIKEVKTHGLLYQTRLGKGRLLVSALHHGGETNAVGRWLLDVLLDHLARGPEPKHAFSEATLRYLREKMKEQRIELVKQVWRFRPDPKNEGLTRGWHLPTTKEDDGWKDIRIGRHWEAQGYPDLDGWAWYRLEVEVPKDWTGREVYLTFEGVDDFYEVYVNGKLAGSGGDLAKKQTAFEERKSHRLTALVKPGERCLLAVRVNDFGGAGGIFRPVNLGTAALHPDLNLLP